MVRVWPPISDGHPPPAVTESLQPAPEDIAYHEAGHVLARLAMGYPVDYVTIKEDPETQSLGATHGQILLSSLTPERFKHGSAFTADEERSICDNITALVAGDVAETHHRGEVYEIEPVSMSHTRDERNAIGQALALWRDDDIANAYTAFLTVRARRILVERWTLVEKVATQLLRQETLEGVAVQALL